MLEDRLALCYELGKARPAQPSSPRPVKLSARNCPEKFWDSLIGPTWLTGQNSSCPLELLHLIMLSLKFCDL